MARVFVTGPADADTDSIFRNLGRNAGVAVAIRYEAEFDNLFRRLERFPESGAPRPALGAATRLSVVSPYVVIYDYVESDDRVLVLRILHGHRKITRRMLKRDI